MHQGEARVLSPVLDDSAASAALLATFRNDTPLRLSDPLAGVTPPLTIKDYPVYLPGSRADGDADYPRQSIRLNHGQP